MKPITNHLATFVLSSTLIAGPALAQKKPATAVPTAAQQATTSGHAVGMIKPGLWEITTVNETAGSTTKRTVTSRTCYAAADVGNVGRLVPQQREFGMKCETRDAKQQGSETTWRVACVGKDSAMSGSGKMNLAAESFNGRAELELKASAAKPTKVEQKITGAWIGPCK